MPRLTAEHLLLAAYLLAGPVLLLTLAVLALVGRYKVLLLSRPFKPLKVPPPRVSVLIPAKDEGGGIAGCLSSVLAQDYPNFELIAINDRSVDDTGVAMDRLAAIDARMRVLHIRDGELPAGWTGKNHALWRGQQLADGEWLLFVDSDVKLDPDVISATVALASNRGYDLLSLLPRLDCGSFWERALLPVAGAVASSMYAISVSNNDGRDTAFANGQYLLIRRDRYDRIGTHESVRDQLCEDVGLANLVKRSGGRSRVSDGKRWASVRMYTSLPAILRGWSRIYYAAGFGNARRMIVALACIAAMSLLLLAGLGWAAYRLTHPTGDAWIDQSWPIAAGVHAAVLAGWMALFYAWAGVSPVYALSFPLTLPLAMYMLWTAIRMCYTRQVTWRGTSYTQVAAGQPAMVVRGAGGGQASVTPGPADG